LEIPTSLRAEALEVSASRSSEIAGGSHFGCLILKHEFSHEIGVKLVRRVGKKLPSSSKLLRKHIRIMKPQKGTFAKNEVQSQKIKRSGWAVVLPHRGISGATQSKQSKSLEKS